MAKRAAVIHVIANIIGTIWFGLLIAFVPIPEVVASWSPNDPARIIANFHTIFNVVNTILLLPFGGLVIKFINKIIKQNKNSDEDDNRLCIWTIGSRIRRPWLPFPFIRIGTFGG